MQVSRVFMLVSRGLTDKTPVCIFPWEKPILEEIHGGNAQEVSIDEMCSLSGAVKVKKIKLKHATSEDAPDMRTQFENMTRISEDANPLDDPETEWGRLMARYGMHATVNVPNVEKVFGSFGNFRTALKDYAKGRTPAFLDTGGAIEDEEEPKKRGARERIAA